jgi:hypothetical protein
MANKNGDKGMQIHSDDGITHKSQVLSLQAVKGYAEKSVKAGRAEYNEGSILTKSKHPIDGLLRRGIIEENHQDSGKRIMTIRDCAFGRTWGRIYNDPGEGDGEIDAMTLYVTTCRIMPKRPMQLIELVCFKSPDMDGNYFSSADYSALYGLAPNIQNAFDLLDKRLMDARDLIRSRLKKPGGTA